MSLIISIMKPIYLLFTLLGTLVVASASLDLRWLTDSWHGPRSVGSQAAGASDLDQIEKQVAAQVLAARQRVHQSRLKPDAELRAWIAPRLEKGLTRDLDAFTTSVQAQFPNYTRLAVCTLQSPSLGDLAKKASEWSQQTEKGFTHQAIVARTPSARPGFECVIVTGRRLKNFQPEDLTRHRGEFYIMCPLCRRGQACEVPSLQRSVSLECPNCQRPCALLAVDTKGQYRYVNEYLSGYAPPARFPAGITRLNEMLLIWNAVVHGIRYTLDAAGGNGANDAGAKDAWQTAAETQQLGTGDCEDSSIYLADWLIARGFDARLVIGHYAERGGHAWVIVRLEGRTYLLESTNRDADMSRPPLLDDVGSRYVPESMIDREGFHTRCNPSAPWDGDYWSQGKWLRVIPNPKQAVASAGAGQEKAPGSAGGTAASR